MNKDRFWNLILLSLLSGAPGNAQESIERPPSLTPPSAPFSAGSNFMSAVGFARWKHNQQGHGWEPQIIKEVVATSPVDGGFNGYSFLKKLEEQVNKHPYARQFVLSWHIDTIGPDWIDDYYLVQVYERDRHIVYDPYSYRVNGNSTNKFALSDELIPALIAKWREFRDQRLQTANPRTQYDKWAELDPDKRLLEWWREQSKS